ncbi:28954_t:CDS:2 [Gigaspora margarita]|uniref:28954_t:CDS:1 n=1 Tax=Gigaspora margarita TaxID=4874 RepID=A0ABN7V5Z0_GIGMA|nr:28954_t:CDS:2 [Gigaspora margarita]
MKEKTKIKDIPEDGAYMVGYCNRKRIEDEVDFEDNVRMMCVERINNKGVENIERNGAIMTCKMDVDKRKLIKVKERMQWIKSVDKFDEIVENELNKGIETAKPEVGDVSEDKGKDANVAEAADEVGENGHTVIHNISIYQ